MKEKELEFDRKRHACYSKKVKRIIQDHLRKKFSDIEAKRLWENIQLKYVEYLTDLPYLGGPKDSHNGAGGTYDCIVLFAYYEVLERKPSLEEIYEMNNELLLPSFEMLGKVFNMNHNWQLKLLNKVFEITAKNDQQKGKNYPSGYIMRMGTFDEGIHYTFKQCPIANFAKEHQLLEMMPAICNSDYLAIGLLHAGLIRKTTCTHGEECDYWIVGNQSPYLKEHPQKKDKDGYYYND